MGGTGIAEGKMWSVAGGVDRGGPREAHPLLLRLLDGGDRSLNNIGLAEALNLFPPVGSSAPTFHKYTSVIKG